MIYIRTCSTCGNKMNFPHVQCIGCIMYFHMLKNESKHVKKV